MDYINSYIREIRRVSEWTVSKFYPLSDIITPKITPYAGPLVDVGSKVIDETIEFGAMYARMFVDPPFGWHGDIRIHFPLIAMSLAMIFIIEGYDDVKRVAKYLIELSKDF